MLTHTHTFVSSSSKHLARDLKAVFRGFFPPLHSTGCKTVMLQNDVQIRAKLLLHAICIMFSAVPSSLGETRNICWCVFVQPPAPNPRGSCGPWLLPSFKPLVLTR